MAAAAAADEDQAEMPDSGPGRGRAGQKYASEAGGIAFAWGVWGFRDWGASETDDILNTTHSHTHIHTGI